MTSQEPCTNNAFGFVFEQYVDNASFLWVLYNIALEQPHYTLSDLEELKVRIDNNLNGLLSNIEISWPLCEAALKMEEPGETFTAAMIAFYCDNHTYIETVIEHSLSAPNCFDALTSALCWLPKDISQQWINTLLLSKNLDHKYIAISVCSKLRQDPGTYLEKLLQREDCIQHQALMSGCIKLIGELKRQDLNPYLFGAIKSDVAEISFWAAWSLTLLGHKNHLSRLVTEIFDTSSKQKRAIELIFRALPHEQARIQIENLVAKNLIREAIEASAILGDPEVIDWLLRLADDPKWSRAAGEAFTFITGVNLEQANMSIEPPEQISISPNDDSADDDVTMDSDENLPWPSHSKLSHHWETIEPTFEKARRYFLGELHTTQTLHHHMKHGTQRQRAAAAMHLAMASPEQAFINVKI